MKLFVTLPLLIPLATAIALLFAWRSLVVQRALSVLGALALLISAGTLLSVVVRRGILVVEVGGWSAPIGISLVADVFSAIMVTMAGAVSLAVAVYSLRGIDSLREKFSYHPLFHLVVMGVCGAFLTGDMFNLYVWFEVMLITSFVLIALGGERAQLEGAIKYVTINLISSAVFLAALGIMYHQVGTLNMADVALTMRSAFDPGLLDRVAATLDASGLQLASRGINPAMANTLGTLFLVTFGVKAALFPLFFWLPASYHTPPVPISAIFAGLLTKVGVYALIRVFSLFYFTGGSPNFINTLLLGMAGITMVVGATGAIAQYDFRRVLSFNLVSHIGYMVMGLAIFTPLALAGAIFYTIHHIVVKTTLFLVSGLVQRLQGSVDLRKMGGLFRTHPGIALLFFIPALSLTGIPPLSGFWPKLALITAGLETRHYWIVAAALLGSLLTLYSMMIIWRDAFWRTSPEPQSMETPSGVSPLTPSLWLPVAVLVGLVMIIGLAAEPVYLLSQQAASQLLDPLNYITSVLARR